MVMARKAEFEEIPPGTYTGICYQSIDLGTQKEDYKGDVKLRHKVLLTWELADCLMEDGRPFAISKEVTAVLNSKSNLSHIAKCMLGQEPSDKFDTSQLLGKACNVMAEEYQKQDHSKGVKIGGFLPLKANESVPKQHNPSVNFDLDRFDSEIFNDLPEWIQNKIKLSPEYAEATGKGRMSEVLVEPIQGETGHLDAPMPESMDDYL